ncbi:ExbD/TolR family protein [Antarcticimicrobium sediminis]|uniref:Biopolymer transporter ExbD n=1 Tax=Antarcticimicrobium sediminis TaxID=2546227 RepID=A0A4R5ERP9_9RHOB|nr:biopolymer transporter ExbD [Antarcticimicrobium sediminis]TDE37515.1 biopolymer transporter ExbD [Antarcticimicrobium sediminis]
MAGLTLKRPTRPRALISLVPMIDVMLILLVFFMVTSTYLNLDMIPAARRSDAPGGAGEDSGGTVMIRLGADGVPVLRGQALRGPDLTGALAALLAQAPLTQVIVLPSGAATTQALVSVMDAATQAGAVRLRVVRLEARP